MDPYPSKAVALNDSIFVPGPISLVSAGNKVTSMCSFITVQEDGDWIQTGCFEVENLKNKTKKRCHMCTWLGSVHMCVLVYCSLQTCLY